MKRREPKYLTEECKDHIRWLYEKTDMRQREIAEYYGITKSRVSLIVNYKEPERKENKGRKFNRDQVQHMKRLRKRGYSYYKIAEIYGTYMNEVRLICIGELYRKPKNQVKAKAKKKWYKNLKGTWKYYYLH